MYQTENEKIGTFRTVLPLSIYTEYHKDAHSDLTFRTVLPLSIYTHAMNMMRVNELSVLYYH